MNGCALFGSKRVFWGLIGGSVKNIGVSWWDLLDNDHFVVYTSIEMKSRGTQSEVLQAANRVAGCCLATRVRLLNRTITGIYDDALRPLGMTSGQMTMLVVIAQNGPIAPGHVAKALNMEKSTVSRNIDRMHSNGWVTVSPGETDRTQCVSLSAKGRRLFDKSLPLWETAQAQAEALLGKSGARSISGVANSVWERLGRG